MEVGRPRGKFTIEIDVDDQYRTNLWCIESDNDGAPLLRRVQWTHKIDFVAALMGFGPHRIYPSREAAVAAYRERATAQINEMREYLDKVTRLLEAVEDE